MIRLGAKGETAVLYGVKVLPDVRIRMRDGVELAIRIIRPDADGKFPALMTYSPYRMLTSLKPASSEREYSNSFNAPHYFAQRGYISVAYDARGTGASGGSNSDMYSDAERQDGYDMVEWIATQPWSNGNVGMWGKSYGAVVAWQVAALAPPHLKAIISRSGTDDVYGDWMYPGGALRSSFIFGGYASMMAASTFAPPDPDSTGEKWAQIWEEHLENNVPWSIGFLQHQTNDAYWRARSVRPDYGRIKCAVFVIGGWADWYQTAELRAFANLKVPKRALIGPWAHYWPEDAFPGPRIDARPEYLKWFDQFLKGTDTGVLSEPPVTIFVNRYQAPEPMYKEQHGFWRQENEWPLTRTRYTPLYLASQGRLEQQASTNEEPERDSYTYRPSVGLASGILGRGNVSPWAMPLDQRHDEAYSLTYTTPELESDLEVTGNPSAIVFVSSTAEVAYFAVRVCDVAPDGTSKLVTDGGLNATHRTSGSQPEALKSGVIYELRFDLNSMSYVFPAGHRIRVAISSADFQNVWPASKSAVNAVMRGMQFPSRVILPVAPRRTSQLPTPEFQPSPNPIPDVVARPEYNVTYDLINQTTTLNMINDLVYGSARGASRASYTVSDQNPAAAMIKSDINYVVSRSIGEIKVGAQMVTTSDANVFHHLVEIEVTVDGRRHFSKSWMTSVPRILN